MFVVHELQERSALRRVMCDGLPNMAAHARSLRGDPGESRRFCQVRLVAGETTALGRRHHVRESSRAACRSKDFRPTKATATHRSCWGLPLWAYEFDGSRSLFWSDRGARDVWRSGRLCCGAQRFGLGLFVRGRLIVWRGGRGGLGCRAGSRRWRDAPKCERADDARSTSHHENASNDQKHDEQRRVVRAARRWWKWISVWALHGSVG